MRRRGFIAAAGTVALAGCSYTVQETDEVESREETISDLRDRLDAKNETVRDLRDRADALEADAEASQEQAEWAKREHAVSLYELGHLSHRYGNGAWSRGLDSAEAGDYALAAALFGQAYADYGNANDAFEKCAEALDDEPDAVETALDVTAAMEEACFDMQIAGAAYAEGRRDEGDRRWRNGLDHRDEAGDGVVPDPTVFEDQL